MGKYKLNWSNIFDVMLPKIEEQLKKNVSKDTTELSKSITGVKHNAKLLAFEMLYYWYYAEFGSAPHWTSHENLIGWCQRQLVLKGATYKGKKKTAEQWSFILQRHIATYGTKPHPFIRTFIDIQFKQILKQSIQELGEDAIMLNK